MSDITNLLKERAKGRGMRDAEHDLLSKHDRANRARSRALTILKGRYEAEFNQILDEERAAEGLAPVSQKHALSPEQKADARRERDRLRKRTTSTKKPRAKRRSGLAVISSTKSEPPKLALVRNNACQHIRIDRSVEPRRCKDCGTDLA